MADVRALIARWRDDPGGTYRGWFLWEERLKNFRAIRRGIQQVVEQIEHDTFGNVYKGSSLETVVGAIAEQRQIFKGADHAFLWKPKLRIPDIYESRDNQLAFGLFLESCCEGEDVVAAFEVEHSTSIYSGIVRLLDLSLGAPSAIARDLFIVAPDDREAEVQAQVRRPAFRAVSDLRVRYLPYGELERHRESMARFGEGLKAIQAVSRVLE